MQNGELKLLRIIKLNFRKDMRRLNKIEQDEQIYKNIEERWGNFDF
ncbi:unnamed protein product [Paramecium sonneborni]|uniref:Uncharacterized protein n=1 Tax=Paramecium sonneborni TaxID=65129 RepID=A0A8S1R5P2_9CILI|nr:unnamed protein product [Paramecium sonneborni]